LYIWRAPLHLWMWSIPPRKKSVYLNHFFCGIRRWTLFLSVLESHFECMKTCKSLTKWHTWIQAHQNNTQILETSLMFYCTTNHCLVDAREWHLNSRNFHMLCVCVAPYVLHLDDVCEQMIDVSSKHGATHMTHTTLLVQY
jgi:hypothetical protein